MSKHYILLLAAWWLTWLAGPAQATIQLLDATNAPVPDGAVLTFTEVTQEEDFGTGEVINMMLTGLKVRNSASQETLPSSS